VREQAAALVVAADLQTQQICVTAVHASIVFWSHASLCLWPLPLLSLQPAGAAHDNGAHTEALQAARPAADAWDSTDGGPGRATGVRCCA
jgi:hypothetical protein